MATKRKPAAPKKSAVKKTTVKKTTAKKVAKPSKSKPKNKYEKMADRGAAFRSPKFSKTGLVGKGSKDYNNETSRDMIDITLDQCDLDIDVVKDPLGNPQNVVIKRGAKKENGKYNEKDIHGRFSDCSKLSSFLNGIWTGLFRVGKKRK